MTISHVQKICGNIKQPGNKMKKVTKIIITVLIIAGSFVIIGAVLSTNKEKMKRKPLWLQKPITRLL